MRAFAGSVHFSPQDRPARLHPLVTDRARGIRAGSCVYPAATQSRCLPEPLSMRRRTFDCMQLLPTKELLGPVRATGIVTGNHEPVEVWTHGIQSTESLMLYRAVFSFRRLTSTGCRRRVCRDSGRIAPGCRRDRKLRWSNLLARERVFHRIHRLARNDRIKLELEPRRDGHRMSDGFSSPGFMPTSATLQLVQG